MPALLQPKCLLPLPRLLLATFLDMPRILTFPYVRFRRTHIHASAYTKFAGYRIRIHNRGRNRQLESALCDCPMTTELHSHFPQKIFI